MKKLVNMLLGIVLFVFVTSIAGAYDLVLVHGLTNKHKWSDSFLDKCLASYGSGNVYVLYLNDSTRVWTRTINGRTLYCCGENDYSAGDDSAAYQAYLMRMKTNLLQGSYGLSGVFNIIAHSMGGLVSREYIYENPYKVKTLVTLGTPHKGSPLASDVDWLAFFIGAGDAADCLKPSWVTGTFNPSYPAPGPVASGGGIYAIGGDADGWDCWGWGGELQLGWDILSTIHWTDNDGLVPNGNCYMTGIPLVTRFNSYDHMELVTKSDVATKALQYAMP
jgi:triacylglycerol lipase